VLGNFVRLVESLAPELGATLGTGKAPDQR